MTKDNQETKITDILFYKDSEAEPILVASGAIGLTVYLFVVAVTGSDFNPFGSYLRTAVVLLTILISIIIGSYLIKKFNHMIFLKFKKDSVTLTKKALFKKKQKKIKIRYEDITSLCFFPSTVRIYTERGLKIEHRSSILLKNKNAISSQIRVKNKKFSLFHPDGLEIQPDITSKTLTSLQSKHFKKVATPEKISIKESLLSRKKKVTFLDENLDSLAYLEADLDFRQSKAKLFTTDKKQFLLLEHYTGGEGSGYAYTIIFDNDFKLIATILTKSHFWRNLITKVSFHFDDSFLSWDKSEILESKKNNSPLFDDISQTIINTDLKLLTNIQSIKFKNPPKNFVASLTLLSAIYMHRFTPQELD